MKKLFIVFLLFSFYFQTFAQQSLKDLSFGTNQTFDVVTWNVEWFPKNGSITIDSVKEIIQAMDADIIACQEISDTTAWKNMVNSIGGYEAIFFPGRYRGLAYVYKTSTVQIQDFYKIYSASQYSNNFPRAPKVLDVTFNGQSFIIINNHLKCCGDGTLSANNSSDEENRRFQAMNLIKSYIDNNFTDKNVILLGDLNDNLGDVYYNNVFQTVLDDPQNYKFVDLSIANGLGFDWSYPNWPSHLDHILISNELFDDFDNTNSSISTIMVDNFMAGGFNEYDAKVSDHRPVGLKLSLNNWGVNTKNEPSEQIHLSVFPTPATDQLNIEMINNKEEITSISIVNVTGQTLLKKPWETQTQRMTLDIQDLESGVYFVVIQTNNSIITRTFLSVK